MRRHRAGPTGGLGGIAVLCMAAEMSGMRGDPTSANPKPSRRLARCFFVRGQNINFGNSNHQPRIENHGIQNKKIRFVPQPSGEIRRFEKRDREVEGARLDDFHRPDQLHAGVRAAAVISIPARAMSHQPTRTGDFLN